MGAEVARRATEAIIRLYHPEVVISAGFAGALDSALLPGHTLRPRYVIDAADGSRNESEFGEGTLLTFGTIADVEQKAKLAAAYDAHAVDMEAAAVARSADAHDVKFLACKVISDGAASRLPPIARFVGRDGQFHTLRFLAYAAVRPWLWSSVMKLARDSRLAASKLCAALAVSDEGRIPEIALQALAKEKIPQ